MSVTSRQKAQIKDERFRASAELYASWRPDSAFAPNSEYLASGWFQNASLQMVTNTKNATSANFARRLKRYLKHRYALEGKAAWELLVHILSPGYDGDDPIVRCYRNKLPRPASGFIQDHPHLVMPLQYEILEYFENAQVDDEWNKQLRLFTLVPTKQGFECSHLKMCSNGLRGLLKRGGV